MKDITTSSRNMDNWSFIDLTAQWFIYNKNNLLQLCTQQLRQQISLLDVSTDRKYYLLYYNNITAVFIPQFELFISQCEDMIDLFYVRSHEAIAVPLKLSWQLNHFVQTNGRNTKFLNGIDKETVGQLNSGHHFICSVSAQIRTIIPSQILL